VGAHCADAGESDVAAVRAETEGAGGEPAAQPPAAALEPGEPQVVGQFEQVTGVIPRPAAGAALTAAGAGIHIKFVY
jgi:hypothetical protein